MVLGRAGVSGRNGRVAESSARPTDLPEIHLVRHGETLWSLSGRHTGRSDIVLTAAGEAMARALAPRLQGIVFTRVCTSPRLRARQTCALAGLGTAACSDPDLEEWDYGEDEGRRTVDIHRDRPDWSLWEDGCPGGESSAQVSERADRLLRRLVRCEGPIALFSHGQFGRVLAARWIGLPASAGRHFALGPACRSVLSQEPSHPGVPVIALWNEAPPAP